MSACSTVEMSSSGRNDLRTNANAPERSAPMAASTLAKPVSSRTSEKGQTPRSGEIRSMPLMSGSFTSTIATSKPRWAMASAAAPLTAVSMAMPGTPEAMTAFSVSTSSVLSSTISTRRRCVALRAAGIGGDELGTERPT